MCTLTLVQQGEVGGIIPLWIMNFRIKSTLSFVDDIRSRSQRNGNVVDAEVRDAFPSPPQRAQLDDEQNAIVESCLSLETEDGDIKWIPLTPPSPFVDTWIKHAKPKKGERSVAVGKAIAIIDCSAPLATAWYFMFCSRARFRTHIEEDNPARLQNCELSLHERVFRYDQEAPVSAA